MAFDVGMDIRHWHFVLTFSIGIYIDTVAIGVWHLHLHWHWHWHIIVTLTCGVNLGILAFEWTLVIGMGMWH